MPNSNVSSPSAAPVHDALVSVDGRTLPLKSTRITGRMRGGLARLQVEQVFHNPYPEALDVEYRLALPVDAAVAGFSFEMDGRRVVGRIDRKSDAAEQFAEAIARGHTAALLEEDTAALFTQRIGNVPPERTMVVRIEIDQRLRWVSRVDPAGGGWEWRFPTVIPPRYGTDPATPPLQVAEGPRPITLEVDVQIADETTADPASPSHRMSPGRGGHVHLPPSTGAMDRDVVLRWPITAPNIGLQLDVARPTDDDDMFGLLTVVPPDRPQTAVPRDLVLLLDTSGSMMGPPLAQAKRIAAAMVQGLGPEDTLELVEFSSSVTRFAPEPQHVDAAVRGRALVWLAGLRSSGGTEMVTGILAALEGVRPDAQRQVVALTDGQIGSESAVAKAIDARLPQGSRLHMVGVGPSVHRGLTATAARAGRGSEHVIGCDEDAEVAVENLRRALDAPLVVGLEVHGDGLLQHAPARLPELLAGQPAQLHVRLKPGSGTLRVCGRTASGPWEAHAHYRTPLETHDPSGIASAFARERIEELELRLIRGDHASRVEPEIEQLGLRHAIATRLTSWVAVDEQPSVDGKTPVRHEVVPQELPRGMSAEALGLRAPAVITRSRTEPRVLGHIATPKVAQRIAVPEPPRGRASRRKAREERDQSRGRRTLRRRGPASPAPAPSPRTPAETVRLSDLAAMLGLAVETLQRRAAVLGLGTLSPDDPVDTKTAGTLGRDFDPAERGMAEVLVVTRGAEGLHAQCRVARGVVNPATTARVVRGGTVVREVRIGTVRVDGLSTIRASSGSRCDVVVMGCDDLRPGDHLVVLGTVE